MKAPLVMAASPRGLIRERVQTEGAERAYEEVREKNVRDVMSTRVVSAQEDVLSEVIVRMIDHDSITCRWWRTGFPWA